MSEILGLALFASVIAIAIIVAIAILYCACIAGFHYCKKLYTRPLSNTENHV
jgi:archaellum component FlaF (FlaF/FlaG flagellin family)